MRPRRALGGAPLVGNRLVHLIYADDTGTSTKDLLALVCAILVRPDVHWLALGSDIEHLKQRVPDIYRQKFIFRASELLTSATNHTTRRSGQEMTVSPC